MMKTIEKQAATLEEAFRLAEQELEQLDAEVEVVSREVLEKGKKGLFGIGSIPASVRISYEEKEPQPEAVHTGDPAQDAKVFIDGLLEKMGIAGEAFPETDEEGQLVVDIRGDNMGAVIGRRGDTLDAIQYLTSLTVNRGREDHIRVTIDTEGYRAKREESLQRLARKMAGKVLKYHKNMTLEPMNPYERRIIHAALQDYNGVTTYSTGTEPNRRVVVAMARGSGRSQRSSNRNYRRRNYSEE